MALEVVDVSLSPETTGELEGSSVEVPRPGDGGDGYTLRLAGRVRSRSATVQSVEVLCGREVVQTAPIARRDHELESSAADQDPRPFDAVVGLLGLPVEPELCLAAVLDDGRKPALATVKLRRDQLRSTFEPHLQPIMLTSPGRAGTTWVIAMLAGHPEIVVHETHPYETWAAQYWVHMLEVLASPVNRAESDSQDWFDPRRVSASPFLTPPVGTAPAAWRSFERCYTERLAGFCQAAIEDWYTTLASAEHVGEPRFFAEKNMHRSTLYPTLMRELYPDGKEVFLVRDFRDMARSRIAYRTRTGRARGPLAHKTEVEFVREDLVGLVADFLLAWRTRQAGSHLARYEDLVRRPAQSLAGILEYIGVDSRPELVEQLLRKGSTATEGAPRHRTSADAEASIGRWRTEGDDAFREACQESFSEALAEFGYG
jgi:hypothetical protein